ncbi:MAG: carbon storage regulator CsrA [Melioribacter sp.]|uniref:carbon storage regulator CsrA n=1 Tax=Rosettibacter primus TaxID=3111523 RepID=UPI00247C12A4|nr:carbon storage regulator CsrA [Melioribacter sp.]
MLILSRKIDEEIKIGSDITIKILSISENQVKIGITAPSSIQIYRGEVYEKVIQYSMEASQSSSTEKVDLSKYKIKKVE